MTHNGSLQERRNRGTVCLADGGDDHQGGGGTDFIGIGLVEVLWKAVSGIINFRISSSIQFRDALYGFCAGIGMGTATLEANMLQQFIAMRETFIHSIFLNLRKAYEELYRYRCLEILEGYGVGPRMLCIMRTYWVRIQIAAKAGGYYGPVFQKHRGVTQWGACHPRSLMWSLTLSSNTG